MSESIIWFLQAKKNQILYKDFEYHFYKFAFKVNFYIYMYNLKKKTIIPIGKN